MRLFQSHLTLSALCLLAMASCSTASATEPLPTGPPTSIASNGTALIHPLIVETPAAPAPAPPPPDPVVCVNGGEFVRVSPTAFLCGYPGPELGPLVPMTIPQMIDVIFADIPWLAAEMKVVIIPREAGGGSLDWRNWDPTAVNPSSGAIGLTQLYGHDGLAASLGYSHQDLAIDWPNLITAHALALASRPADAPWRCNRCSIHH